MRTTRSVSSSDLLPAEVELVKHLDEIMQHADDRVAVLPDCDGNILAFDDLPSAQPRPGRADRLRRGRRKQKKER